MPILLHGEQVVKDGAQIVKDGERELLYMSVYVIHPTLKLDRL